MGRVRRELHWLAERVGPKALVVVIVGSSLLGAVIGAVVEAVHQYGLPHSPKGTPPS